MARKKPEATEKVHPKARAKKKKSADSQASTEQVGIRNSKGRFTKGSSGNPGGRPKEAYQLRDLARQYTEEAITTLVSIMRSENLRAAAAAANIILDRGWGKAPQTMELNTDTPMRMEIAWAA